MKNIYILADNFLKAVEKTGAEDLPQVKIAAGRKNRKQLERDLAYAKDIYSKRRSALEESERRSKDLQSIIDRDSKEVERTRADIMRCYDTLKNMDLHDIHEVRFMNDDIGYVKNKRLFRLDDNALVPFKRKKPEDELFNGLEEDKEDELDASDELLASLME